MKIKRKVEMNLPQLLEWGWGNPSLSRNKRFFSKDENLGITKHCVHFNDFGYPEVDNRYCLEPTDTFTVEVEEDITEHSIFNELVALRGDDSYWKYEDASIYAFNKEKIKAIYIPNDDFTMTLIWRDGKMVE